MAHKEEGATARAVAVAVAAAVEDTAAEAISSLSPSHLNQQQPFSAPTQPIQIPPNNPNLNPYKLTNNVNYCWTHGGAVIDDHTSPT